MTNSTITDILRIVSPEMVSGLKTEPDIEELCQDIKQDMKNQLPNIVRKWQIDSIPCEILVAVYIGLWNRTYSTITDISEKRDILYLDLITELRLQEQLTPITINTKGLEMMNTVLAFPILPLSASGLGAEYKEYLTGVDGINSEFKTKYPFLIDTSQVELNGLILENGSDYVETNSSGQYQTIRFAVPPQKTADYTDEIYIKYNRV